MGITKTLLALATVVSVCVSQNININGTVTGPGGAAIEGAIVMLEEHGYKDTTGADGSFTIAGAVGINDQLNQSFSYKISAAIKNGLLCITVAEKSLVEVVAYTLQGKVFYSIQKTMNAGTHSISLPHKGSGVYFYKIKTGSSEFVLKSNSIGNMSFAIALPVKESPSTELAIRLGSHIQIDDIIKSMKSGYLNYRVKVTNSDTSGIEIMMIECADTVTDVDGNVYNAVKIGDQVWTVVNLRTTKYNDGTDIPQITDNVEWETDTNGAYCYYDNTTDDDSIVKFGALYNWYAVETGKLAPEGWHVPDSSDWDELRDYLIANGYNWDGTTSGNKIGKSMAAKTDWRLSGEEGDVGNDFSSNNSSGFSALPGGYRSDLGSSSSIGYYGYWWSATEIDASFVYGHHLYFDYYSLVRSSYYKESGFSVRLLRD